MGFFVNSLMLEPSSTPQCEGQFTPPMKCNIGGCNVGFGSNPTLPSSLEGRMRVAPFSILDCQCADITIGLISLEVL